MSRLPPVFLALFAAVGLVAAATAIWGLPALAMAALAMVPVVFALMIAVTRG